MTPEERFATKYVVNDMGCFVWIGSTNGRGRGRFTVSGKKVLGYRWAWEQENGPVPEDKELDHYLYPDRCIGAGCANPAHVRPVTRRENNLRSNNVGSWNRAKTHCSKGHEYTEENTKWITNGGKCWGRRCRTCMREDSQRRRDAGYVPPSRRKT